MLTERINSSPDSLPPFLKWPGGKRWACKWIVPLVQHYLRGVYHEPFLGGGAVYFSLRPEAAVLSDINPDLINVYRQVRFRHRVVIDELKRLKVDKRTYDRVRSGKGFSTGLDRAVRLLYLNRTAFAGIYRVNQNGTFNVPFGGGQRTPAILWETAILQNSARALRGAKLCLAGYETSFDSVGRGDVIYCDPTYTVAHNDNGFQRYNERLFTWDDQVRLAGLCIKAARRGATVLVSNAHHERVRKLYSGHEEIVLDRNSGIARKPEFRQGVKESLFVIRMK